MWRAFATRGIWYLAAAGEISGSTPDADAVTRSTGTGAVLPGSAARNVAMRCLTASISAGLVGPRFDAPDDDGLFGNGDVADGRGQKYFGSVNACPMSSEPSEWPSFSITLPFAACAQIVCAIPVTASGYNTPVRAAKTSSR